jgi:ABC-type nickel/cobalt efflux system permease component RcnA
MIKSLVVAAALTIGLAGYAVAQEATPAAPMAAAPMKQHHHYHHYHHHHHYYHHHHHMHHEMAPAAPTGAPKS